MNENVRYCSSAIERDILYGWPMIDNFLRFFLFSTIYTNVTSRSDAEFVIALNMKWFFDIAPMSDVLILRKMSEMSKHFCDRILIERNCNKIEIFYKNALILFEKFEPAE